MSPIHSELMVLKVRFARWTWFIITGWFYDGEFSESFAYRAGAIWANNHVDRCLPFVGYPAIFSSTILPYEVAALSATLSVIQSADERRKQLFRHSEQLRHGLLELGFTIRSQSQIIALETGDERNTENVRDFLENNGVFGAVFVALPRQK